MKLSEAIKCVQEQNHWAYGSKRMAKCLVAEGFAEKLNHKRVERVMSLFNLHAKIRRRRYPRNYYFALKENPVELPRNILDRNFSSEHPMQKLVTDITYLPTNEGWVYMAAVLDLWNREVVSYRIGQHISLDLVKDVVAGLPMKLVGICILLALFTKSWLAAVLFGIILAMGYLVVILAAFVSSLLDVGSVFFLSVCDWPWIVIRWLVTGIRKAPDL